ncbi:MFS superfamily sulfate permease-like transporter [Lewinella aquimaris]|uniref:MFS superfamily sulfate permease-like transporter n=1 Tax=Neolewinella aquimaris TaxID=1835722 RepID=A0A840E697_9BACT|nr:DUF2975 domain-containing protein [Neolewinella aquimaris]MBB4080580.1 MFS superfamily sulfate permease-like transporter [Neolewinella aquimaris]
MKRPIATFLQAVTVMIGILAIFVLVRFPMMEGRATDLDLASIYLDPFILYGYASSIAFFVLLYQVFQLFGYIGRDEFYSPCATKTLRRIKFCAIVLGASIVAAGLYIREFHHEDDDPAGFLAICIMGTFIAIVVATAATMLEKSTKRSVTSGVC